MTTPSQIELINLEIGDTIPVAEILANMVLMGIVTDATNPDLFSATMDAFQTQAVLTVPVLQGPQGNPGSQSLTLRFQNDGKTEPLDLPTDLGDFESDLGRFWVFPITDPDTGIVIATTIYIWTGVVGGIYSGVTGLGQGYVQIPVGTPGPPGPYPYVTPELVLTEPGNGDGPYDTDSWVTVQTNTYVSILGKPTGGTWTFTVTINAVTRTTSSIAYNAAASAFESALEALSNIGSGNVSVIGQVGGPYTIIWQGDLAEVKIGNVHANSSFTGGSSPVVLIEAVATNPVVTFNLAVPDGIEGPCAPLGSFINVDFQTNQPSVGDTIVCSTRTTPTAPTSLAVSGSTSGGSIAAGTYYWKVTATIPNGETLPTTAVSATLTGSTSSASLSWTAPTGSGATGYNVYRGTTSSTVNQLVGVITSGAQVTFIDKGGPTASISPPTTGVESGLNIWVPQTPEQDIPLMYTVPEGAFADSIGITFGAEPVTIGSYIIPAQTFTWKPFIFGQFEVSGIYLSLNPLLNQARVLLGASQIVAYGVGNTEGSLTLVPTLGASESDPDNDIGLVSANETATITIQLIGEGLIGLYDFNTSGAQLCIMVIPQED